MSYRKILKKAGFQIEAVGKISLLSTVDGDFGVKLVKHTGPESIEYLTFMIEIEESQHYKSS